MRNQLPAVNAQQAAASVQGAPQSVADFYADNNNAAVASDAVPQTTALANTAAMLPSADPDFLGYRNELSGLFGADSGLNFFGRAVKNSVLGAYDLADTTERLGHRGASELLSQAGKGVEGVALAAGAVPIFLDRVAGVVTGSTVTGLEDSWFKHMVDPAVAVGDKFATPASAPLDEKIVSTAADLASMLGEIGLAGKAGSAVSEMPAAADSTLGALKTLFGKTLAPSGTFTGAAATALAQGGTTMLPPAVISAFDSGRKIYQQTGDLNTAMRSVGANYLTTTLGGIIPIGFGGSLAARLATGAASGLTTGEASRTLTNAIMPDNSQEPALTTEDRFLAALMGAGMGGFLGHDNVASAVDTALTHAENGANALQAVHLKNVVTSLGEQVDAHPLTERAPDVLAKFLQEATTDETGAPKELFIDGKTLDSTFAKLGVSDDEVARKLPDVAQQLQTVRSTNAGDVRIPVSDFLTYVKAPELRSALLEHLKVSPDGPTAGEAQAFLQNEQAEAQKTAGKIVTDSTPVATPEDFAAKNPDAGINAYDQYLSQHPNQQAVFDASKERLRSDFEKSIFSTGRFTENQARLAAIPFAEHYAANAPRLGMTPEALASKAGKVGFSSVDTHGFDQGALPAVDMQRIAAQPLSAWREDIYARDPALGKELDKTGVFDRPDDGAIYKDELNRRVLASGERATAEEVKARADKAVADSLPELTDRYIADNTKNGSLTLDVDNARELFPDYAASKASRAAFSDEVHEAAAKIIDTAFTKALAKKPTPDDSVVTFLAGGSGSGKSAARELAGSGGIMVDGTMANYEKAKANVQQVLDSGREADIAMTIRNPVEAFRNGVLPRAVEDGRIVPLDVFTRTHAQAPGTVVKLAEYFKDDPRVHVGYIDNTAPAGEATPGTVADLVKVRYNGVSDLARALEQAHAEGKVPNHIYDAYREKLGLGSTQANGETGKQSEQGGAFKQGPKGSFDPTTLVISFMRGADSSTIAHEASHFFLESLRRMSELPDAPAVFKNDLDTVLRWGDIPGATPEARAAAWAGMSTVQQTPLHEQFARAGELWWMENKAPSEEMRPVIGRFWKTIVGVYKSVENFLSAHPEAGKLNDDVRQVFGRLTASDDAITRSEKGLNYAKLFDSADKAGVSNQDFDAYVALGGDATDTAIADMGARSLKVMKWVSNAQGRALRGLQAKAQEARDVVRAEAQKEVDAMPVNQARQFLKTGETVDPKSGELIKAQEGFKLNSEAVKEMYPKGALGSPDLTKLRGMTNSVGLHPDLVAPMFGFRNGDHLVRSLADAEDPKVTVDGLTDKYMLERHSDLSDPTEIAAAVSEAVHNDARARFLAAGLKILTKSAVPVRALVSTARQVANTTLGAMRISNIRPGVYLSAEAKANKEALANAASDPKAAINAQRAALLHNQLARQAHEAGTTIRNGLSYFGKFDKTSARNKLDVDVRDVIDQVLDKFDLRKNPSVDETRPQQNLREWLNAQSSNGYTPFVSPEAADPATRMHYKQLTLDQFNALVDTIKGLEEVGRNRKTITIQGARVALDDYVNEKLVPKLMANGTKFKAVDIYEKAETRHSNLVAIALDHFNSWRLSLSNQLLAQSFKANRYDRHEILGPFNEAITSPILEANYNKVRMLDKAGRSFGEMGDKLGRQWQDSLTNSLDNTVLRDPNEPGEYFPMTRGKLVTMATHFGNESNFNKLVRGYGWNAGRTWKYVMDNMTEKDWQAAQHVWDMYEEHFPAMLDQAKRLGNTAPDKIEPREFDTPFGKQRGGYAAIEYDPLRSRRGEKEATGNAMGSPDGLFGNSYFRPDVTTNGALNSRLDNYTDVISLDFHGIARRLHETIHDLAYRETLMDANKIISHPDFRTAMRKAYGNEAYTSLQKWLGDTANVNSVSKDTSALTRAVEYTRLGVVVNAIAFRASTFLKHSLSAGFKSSGYFAGGGGKYFAKRFAAIGTNYTHEIEGAKQKFGEIFARSLQQDRDFKQTSHAMFEPDSLRAKAERAGHMAIAWGDLMTAVPTAWAAYDWAIAEGIPVKLGGTGKPMTEAQAVDYANRTVREAHGTYTEAGRSNIMNNKDEAVKIFTTLYSFMNTAYGQQLDGYDKLRTAGISNPAVFARVFMSILVPGIAAAYIKSSGPKDDSKSAWAKWISLAFAEEVAASVPGGAGAMAMAEGYGGELPPTAWMKDVISAGKDVGHAGKEIVTGKIPTGKGKPARDILNALGVGFHVPGLGQLGSSIQYGLDVHSGKKHPQSKAELIKGLILGH